MPTIGNLYQAQSTQYSVRQHFGWPAIGWPSEFYPLEWVEQCYAIKSN